MTSLLVLLLGIATSLPAGSLAHSMRASTPANDPRSTSRELIVGGSNAALGEYPYFATLIAADGTVRCGGTLISSTKVLTTASCLYGPDGGLTTEIVVPPTVRIGNTNLTNGEEIATSCAIIHPNFYDGGGNGGVFYNLAIIELANASTTTTKFATLNSDASTPATSGEKLTVVGFGGTSRDDPRTKSDVLKKADTTFVPMEECRTKVSCQSSDYHVCHATTQNSIGVCFGDGGGPLLNASGVQVGVIASVFSGCASGQPDSAMSVARAYDWIQEQVTTGGNCTQGSFTSTFGQGQCNCLTKQIGSFMCGFKLNMWHLFG